MARVTEHHFQLDGSAPQRRLRLVDANSPPPARRKISVLYVEDDTDDIFLLSHQLRTLPSFEVEFVHASTQADARFEVSQRQYDIILCDFWLGAETTIPLIDELKNSATATPVILVSSLENDDIELIGRRAGADGFVAKGDLTSASLDRVFLTLLKPQVVEPAARNGGAVSWLRALMETLDRTHDVLPEQLVKDSSDDSALLRNLIDEILGQRSEMRQEIIDRLAGFERATRGMAGISRLEAAMFVADGVRKQRLRARGGAQCSFQAPAIPIYIEANPELFGDLIDGFLAEAGDLLAKGIPVNTGLLIDDGLLVISLTADVFEAPEIHSDLSIVEAAAVERRLLVEALVQACGGLASFAWSGDCLERGEIARIVVPLRFAGSQTVE